MMDHPATRADHIQKVLAYTHGGEFPLDLVERCVDEAVAICDDTDWTPKYACNLIWRVWFTDGRPPPFPGYRP